MIGDCTQISDLFKDTFLLLEGLSVTVYTVSAALIYARIETTCSTHRPGKAQSPRDGRCTWLLRRKGALRTKD